jgi:UDP-N-acetylglucosamine--N-acetylmuramyl-(pentapeptide) pyrophosphoryl-undecaprenol N-acetylglucosamine transferase
MMKIVVTGGGTGGHTMPALSVALAAQQAGAEILYVGSERGIENRVVPAYDVPFTALEVYPLSKPWSATGAKALIKFWQAYRHARKLLNDFQPDVVFGTGGYAAAAVLMAQIKRKGPTVLHEQNIIPGRVNAKLGCKSSVVCLAFSGAESHFSGVKTEVVGMPLRSEVTSAELTAAQARERFGLSPDRFTVVVVGGSQGAQGLNEVILSTVQHLPQQTVQWLHVCGEQHSKAMRHTADAIGLNGNYKTWSFLEGVDVANAYRAADMLVCRAGASTLFEIAYWGLPAVLVPYPYAFADHQRYNAEYFTQRGAAEMINQFELTPASLSLAIERWRSHEGQRQEISERVKALSIPDSTERVLEVLQQVSGKKFDQFFRKPLGANKAVVEIMSKNGAKVYPEM